MERYSRLELILGSKKLKTLQSSCVTVLGLGAVGGYAMEALARAGIGRLRLVDFDVIQESNLNRQILALESTVGRPKTDVAKERVLQINSSCQVDVMPVFAKSHNLDQIVDNHPDIVVDAIDSLGPKVHVLAGLVQKNIPVVSSMGAALRTDPCRMKIGNLFHSRGCPLARQVRKRLKRLGVDHGIMCVYSDESVQDDFLGDLADVPGTGEEQRQRRTLGSLPTVTGIAGLMMAHYVIDFLCKGFRQK